MMYRTVADAALIEAAQRIAPLVRVCRDEGECEGAGIGGDARGAAVPDVHPEGGGERVSNKRSLSDRIRDEEV